MATIRKQRVGKYTYWQIIESKRVDDKPRPVVLMHLGTAEQLLYKLKEGPVQKKIRSASHGSVSAFWRVVEEMDLLKIFNQYLSPQIRDELTVGKSLLLAAIHRAIKPGSKSSFSSWAEQTSLPEIAGFDPDKLDSQHFWAQMDTVTDEQLEKVEKALTLKMMEKGLFSLKLLFYDLTNFFTYIASPNEKAELVQRGRNKQKRNDLRQFGLAQVVTKEFLIPVFTEIYEGNKSDNTMFDSTLTRLRTKLSELNLNIEELTIVFDKGSNSKDNFAKLDGSQIPYVASLTPSHHEDLLDIPFSQYRKVQVGGQELLCYRTTKEVWGKERTIVIYISERLRQGQIRGLNQAITKKYKLLEELKTKLNAPRARKKSKEDVQRKIRAILHGEKCDQIIKVSILDNDNGRFDIDWCIDTQVYQWITENLFGKRILVTCREEWSEKEIIAAYQGQCNVERVFKHLKNPYHNTVHPQYHWTDQKIKVHTFICLTGLLLSQILWKKAREAGYNYSLETLIDKLTGIRKAELITMNGLKGKPVKETQLEEMEPELQELYTALIK
ncbi:MAG: IS1634 family transposase [Bacillota bacterium]|nr:IS1634 family transposase [Bacillota bacterium]